MSVKSALQCISQINVASETKLIVCGFVECIVFVVVSRVIVVKSL